MNVLDRDFNLKTALSGPDAAAARREVTDVLQNEAGKIAARLYQGLPQQEYALLEETIRVMESATKWLARPE